MKKVVSLILVLVFALSLIPLNAFAYTVEPEPETGSGTYYNIDWRYDKETKTMYFSDNGSDEKAPKIVMPDFSEYESSDAAIWAEAEWRPGYPWYSYGNKICNYAEHIVIDSSVTELADYQCYDFFCITEITVPETVKKFGTGVFAGCSKLASIDIPEGIEGFCGGTIARTAYYKDEENWENNVIYYKSYCLGIKTFYVKTPLTVKDGTRYIAKGAFWFYQPSTLYLPEGLEVIDELAFEKAYIETVELPSSLIKIGDGAFSGSKLTSVSLPKNVKDVSLTAFENCSSLTEINADSENEYYSSVDGVLFSKDKKDLLIYPCGKIGDYYEIPSSVKTVYADFSVYQYSVDCLKNLIIPKTVNKIVNPINAEKCYFMGSPSRYLKISSETALPKNVITCKVKQSKKKFTYSGKRKTPRVKVYSPAGKKLKKGTDYTVTLPKGRREVGYYTIKVTLKGKYKGSFNVEYKIAPRPTTVKKVKAGSTTAKVKWGKQKTNINGYQLQYSGSKSFSYLNEVKTLKGKNKTEYTIKNLKIDREYYVRVRTYKTVKGEKVFSKWSKPKRFKTDLPV